MYVSSLKSKIYLIIQIRTTRQME